MNKFQHFAIYGGGSWGTALACAVSKVTKQVDLYLRDPEVIKEILQHRTNSKYFGTVKLADNILPSNQVSVLKDQEVIIIAVPSTAIIQTINALRDIEISADTVLLIATKGVVGEPVQLLSEKIKSLLPNRIAFIAGPNFASEVVQDLLTSITIACEDIKLAEKIAASVESKNLVTSITADIITVQIAGAIKNIIAIKSGIFDAMGYKRNAKAWLITQGLQEIAVLSQALGGKAETLLQPGVLGDLVLTCYSKTSRNTKFGYELYHQSGHDINGFLKNYPYLVEGAESVKLITKLANKCGVDLPVITSVAQALKLSE
ncbi:NAD(P)H-dependent glycerol-3-phosphate dehydrogenase [Candidatus Trichorickettsia mobilis]|uniref:NAD(P)H-dependent glycerol-3-phosphate dehydrogenase n=1 Tax=Candidatus Trichorickettsia mobilis TaxID=1346319 RepID=UPI0029318C66|nr:NAD(P)H-dependent glycerol-3-phosphate dehydrogenase [Candidatus Trichorickettsia mobilis]